MANYKLNILFSSNDLKAIYEVNEKVVISKNSSNGNPVAWVSFQPFEHNCINWSENYFIYASISESVFTSMFNTPAIPKQTYIFGNGMYEPPIPNPQLEDNEYAIINKMDGHQYLTFGLAQSVECNGKLYESIPINAVKVLFNQTAKFIPHEIISIFLESRIDSSTIVENVTSTALDVNFNECDLEITVQYDLAFGGFKQI